MPQTQEKAPKNFIIDKNVVYFCNNDYLPFSATAKKNGAFLDVQINIAGLAKKSVRLEKAAVLEKLKEAEQWINS